MATAVPILLSSLAAGSTVKQSREARKDQNAALEQQTKLIGENQQQSERAPTALFKRRRRAGGPGFSDAGAASLATLTPTGAGTLLGQ